MKTKILLAAVAGALVLPVPMASQADVMSGMDFKISGRVAAGIVRNDSDVPGQDAAWDLGTTVDGDRTDSRITLTADRETDIGTAGFKLERDWKSDGLTDNRHQYVYFGGDWGTLYFGNHGTPYGMGTGWDQSYFYGGQWRGSDRRDGIGYTYNSGALDFGISLTGDDGDPGADEGTKNRRVADETADYTTLGVSYDFGVVKVGASHEVDNTESDYDRTGITVSGSVDRFSWWVGYEQLSDAVKDSSEDLTNAGLFLQYSISDNDTIYLEYEIRGDDDKTTARAAGDPLNQEATNTVIGYAHTFGGGAALILEYGARDFDGNCRQITGSNPAANSCGNGFAAGYTGEIPDPSNLHLGVRVSF